MKKTFLRLASLITALSLAFSVNVFAVDKHTLNVNAKSAYLMEPTTGKVILDQNADVELPPASVTKIMSILLIFEAIEKGKIKWDDVVTVSEHAASMGGSQVFLEPMEQQSVRDLTKCVVVSSANDAVVALAEFVGGSEEFFVTMMNDKAKELGMNHTHFVNACGLDTEGHYTSAKDIALMSQELIIKYPAVFDFTKIWMDNITHQTSRGETEFGLSNTNKLIKGYKYATGLKTGSTSNALFCVSATAEREGMQLIGVIMGAPDSTIRFHEATAILDYGFANYGLIKGETAGTIKGECKVLKGNCDSVPLAVKEQINCLVEKDKEKSLDSQIDIFKFAVAPAPAGTKGGEIVYYFEGNEVGSCDLITTEDIKKASFGKILTKVIRSCFEEDYTI